ncbi:uncharacterized protein LOC133923422 [Phragmites australis]|uniref:uncharacterized protein LOC133923422 n=1 Tax=Phragmites australis TaxID=29695 RepID=UPI002D7706F8|nr:uncharacterized protein LOC133923422 [Phragmites australis]
MAAGGGAANLEPVRYHMSDDEEDKAFNAGGDKPGRRPQTPRPYDDIGSPVYSLLEPDEHMLLPPPSVAVPPPASLQSPWSMSCLATEAEAKVYDGVAQALFKARWKSIKEEQEANPSDEPWSPNSGLPLSYYEDSLDPVGAQRQGTSFAEDALYHYNADPDNKVKYELVEAGLNNCILTERGSMYGHVNFVARPRTEHGGVESLPERFFFAEVHHQVGRDTCIPTCLRSLDSEDERVGGVGDDPIAERSPWNVSIDYCISCNHDLKHPKDGTCYRAGHFHTLP